MPFIRHEKYYASIMLEPLFATCSQQSLAALLPQMTERRCQAGEAIFSTTDKATHFYLLLQGSVRLISRWDGSSACSINASAKRWCMARGII